MADKGKKDNHEKTLRTGYEIFNFVKDIASKTGDILATGNSAVKLIKVGIDGSMTALSSIPKSLLEGESVPMGLIKELGAWGASSAVGDTIIVATNGSIATAGAATILGAATLTAAAGALYGALWKTAYEYSKENPIWEGARDMKLFDHNDVDLRDLYKGSFQYIDAVPDKVSLKDPGNPLQHGLAALGLKSDDVDITRTEAGEDGSTSESRDIRDKDTSEVIGSYAGTPTGCEMTAGNRKVVMSRITDSDVSLETYARNDEGDFELLGQSRISDNDGITVRRPFMAC